MATRVDTAMSEHRPEKETIRALWGDLVENVLGNVAGSNEPVYTTLSGAEGRDIRALVDRGVIRLTEVGAVAPEDAQKVVAIENRSLAVLELQERFPGLRIVTSAIQNIICGPKVFAWPEGDNKKFCRAAVVNLDLDECLKDEDDDGHTIFPILEWVSKLSQLHAQKPRTEWHLCLTLHGEINWSPSAGLEVQSFLAENFCRDSTFSKTTRGFIGDVLFERIETGAIPDMRELSRVEQQKLLMVFVPKKIASFAFQHGYRLTVDHNLHYGGGKGTAPMVTWIIHFQNDRRASANPDAVYRESLRAVLVNAGNIAADGEIQTQA